MSTELGSLKKLEMVFNLLVSRHPSIEDACELTLKCLGMFDSKDNEALARHYVGFISRTRHSMRFISFTSAEYELYDEALIDVTMEILFVLSAKKSS